MLITTRPRYQPTWVHAPHVTTLSLGRLSQGECALLVRAVVGRRSFPPEIEEEILLKTDGVPLFVEELTKMVVRSELLEEGEGGFRLRRAVTSSLAIPSTLQDSLRARFDQ
ncbi:hypothetical protein J7E62_11260 [Variovorax paradoxus]|nr:hypothetical protein [Variovorax paradoxus]